MYVCMYTNNKEETIMNLEEWETQHEFERSGHVIGTGLIDNALKKSLIDLPCNMSTGWVKNNLAVLGKGTIMVSKYMTGYGRE